MKSLFLLIILVGASAKNKKIPETLSDIVPSDEFCENNLCVPKCCQKGFFLFGFGVNKKCVKLRKKTLLDFTTVPIYTRNLTLTGVLGDRNVTWIRGRVLNSTFNATSFDDAFLKILPIYYLTEEGILHVEVPNKFNRWSTYNWRQFCMDFMIPMPKYKLNNFTLRFLTEHLPKQKPVIYAFNRYGTMVSVFFLALLLVVYGILHELRNLSGKVLMAYVTSFMGAFLLLFVIQVGNNRSEVCKGLAYCIYFLLIATFCWMNVMSYDIWWTFRGYAKTRSFHRRGENFKFGMYCIYGWGLPAALTVILIVLNEMNLRHMPWIIKPNIPHYSCFIDGDEKVFYLYIPMLILIICNCVFFLMTIWRLHQATAVLDSAAARSPAAHRRQKYRFLVYLKLSVIMGINWVLEIISYFSPNFQGWYISDIYNTLIGLSIFIIFVCKKSVLRKLRKRLSEYNSCWTRSRTLHSRSRTSKTTESDTSTDAPVCLQPMGPVSSPTPNGKQ